MVIVMVKVKVKVYEKINYPPTVIGVIVIGLRKREYLSGGTP